MAAVRHSVVLFIVIIGLSFSLPQAHASQHRHRDSEGLKLTREFNGTLDVDESLDGAGRDVPGEVLAKITYKRTAKEPVAMEETDPEGRFVMLKNDPSTGFRQDVSLAKWSLQRQIADKNETITYTFRYNVLLRCGKSLKIWAGESSSEACNGDLVFGDHDSWGTGDQVVTTLLNDKDEEEASLIQKTLYS